MWFPNPFTFATFASVAVLTGGLPWHEVQLIPPVSYPPSMWFVVAVAPAPKNRIVPDAETVVLWHALQEVSAVVPRLVSDVWTGSVGGCLWQLAQVALVVVSQAQVATDPPTSVLNPSPWQYVVQPHGLPDVDVGENAFRLAPVAFANVTCCTLSEWFVE